MFKKLSTTNFILGIIMSVFYLFSPAILTALAFDAAFSGSTTSVALILYIPAWIMLGLSIWQLVIQIKANKDETISEGLKISITAPILAIIGNGLSSLSCLFAWISMILLIISTVFYGIGLYKKRK